MSLVATLQQCPESPPQWLQQPSPTFDRASFFGSRTVFYPGSGDDGQPVSVCARAHAAHAFIYVDYGVSQKKLAKRLHGVNGQGLRGYRVEREQQVLESVLRPGGMDCARRPREVAQGSRPLRRGFSLRAVRGLRARCGPWPRPRPRAAGDAFHRRRRPCHLRRPVRTGRRNPAAVSRGRSGPRVWWELQQVRGGRTPRMHRSALRREATVVAGRRTWRQLRTLVRLPRLGVPGRARRSARHSTATLSS